MNVLHVHSLFIRGGIESAVVTCAQELRRYGIESSFFFNRAQVSAAELGREHRFPFYSWAEVRLEVLLMSGGFDVLVIEGFQATRVVLRAIERVGFGGGVVLVHHAAFEPYSDVPCWCDAVVSVCQVGLQKVGKRPGLCRVIPNGVDTSLFAPSGEGFAATSKPVVCWVGRSKDPHKNFGWFAQFVECDSDDRSEHWVFDTSEPGDAERLLRPSSHRGRVCGGVPHTEMPKVLRSVARSGGVLVMTSATEACPMVLLEAMACGCPVLAPRVGGIPEIVKDGVTGLLYELGDGPKEAWGRASGLLGSSRRGALVDKGLQKVRERFSVERMAKEYSDLFREVYGGACRGKGKLGVTNRLWRAVWPGVAVCLRARRAFVHN